MTPPPVFYDCCKQSVRFADKTSGGVKKFAFLCSLLILTGCSSYGPEELDRLTKEDPGFKQMIITRDQMRAQMHLIKEDLLSKKKVMDAQIDKLRAQYDAISKLENQKIEKYQAAIDSNRALLKRDSEMAEASLESKRTEFEGYHKTLTDVQKVLKESKGITFSVQEKQKWQEKVLLLSEKMRPLKEEIEDLNLQIRLKKRKISFLH